MPFSGTIDLYRNDVVCDANYNIVVTKDTWTVNTAGLVQSITSTVVSFQCDCCKPCICCCVLPDAGAPNQCSGSLNETVAGECTNPAVGNLCPGSGGGCDQCRVVPTTRSKSCLSGSGTSSMQIKINSNVVCGCAGVNCSYSSGNCVWTCFSFCCTIAPNGGC